MTQYEKLMKEFPEIAKVISGFPEAVQPKAFDVLVSSLIGGVIPVVQSSAKPVSMKSNQLPQVPSGDITGIAMKTQDGQFHFSVRDIKATNQWDAAKRLTYVLIRAYTKVMGTETVSRKEVINPFLTSWRVYDGNTRRFLANDPGLVRNGDQFSLDIHAEQEADGFIRDILNTEVTAKWKPGSTKRGRKKKNSKDSAESSDEQ